MVNLSNIFSQAMIRYHIFNLTMLMEFCSMIDRTVLYLDVSCGTKSPVGLV